MIEDTESSLFHKLYAKKKTRIKHSIVIETIDGMAWFYIYCVSLVLSPSLVSIICIFSGKIKVSKMNNLFQHDYTFLSTYSDLNATGFIIQWHDQNCSTCCYTQWKLCLTPALGNCPKWPISYFIFISLEDNFIDLSRKEKERRREQRKEKLPNKSLQCKDWTEYISIAQLATHCLKHIIIKMQRAHSLQ